MEQSVIQEIIEEVKEITLLESSSHMDVVASNVQPTEEKEQEEVKTNKNVAIKHREAESPVEGNSELQFIFDLEDGYTKLSFPSNNVLK